MYIYFQGDIIFAKNLTCRFCYQIDFWDYTCEKKICNSANSPPIYYRFVFIKSLFNDKY